MPANFTKMIVWQKALDLAEMIHDVTEQFPNQERFELTSQMRRASVSISSNIAEGLGRFTSADKRHKYVQSRGELIELITQIHYSFRVKYLEKDKFEELIAKTDEIHKILNTLIHKLSL